MSGSRKTHARTWSAAGRSDHPARSTPPPQERRVPGLLPLAEVREAKRLGTVVGLALAAELEKQRTSPPPTAKPSPAKRSGSASTPLIASAKWRPLPQPGTGIYLTKSNR